MLLGVLSLAWPDEARADCPVPAVDGVQPYHSQVSQSFDQAAANALGDRGPSYPNLRQGYPTYREVPASFSPTILKAIGYLESRWRQFRAAPGATGPTLINSASDPYCAYGIMQVVSGMSGTSQFDPPRVAAEYQYNVGTGALILLWKWNYLAKLGTAVGDNDPAIMEDWYFAIWAYHNGSWLNNPHNPRYFQDGCANRNLYWDPFDYSSYPARCYPYQELIWGYVANPPPGPDGQPLWQSIRLSFPDPAAIGYDFEPVYMPGHIDDPQPIHRDSIQANPTPTPSPTPTPTATPSPTPTRTPVPLIDLHLPRRGYLPLINVGAAK